MAQIHTDVEEKTGLSILKTADTVKGGTAWKNRLKNLLRKVKEGKKNAVVAIPIAFDLAHTSMKKLCTS